MDTSDHYNAQFISIGLPYKITKIPTLSCTYPLAIQPLPSPLMSFFAFFVLPHLSLSHHISNLSYYQFYQTIYIVPLLIDPRLILKSSSSSEPCKSLHQVFLTTLSYNFHFFKFSF